MVGEYTNKRVGRLIAAGSRSLIDDAVRVISRLKAIHVNEYEDCLLYTSPSPRD